MIDKITSFMGLKLVMLAFLTFFVTLACIVYLSTIDSIIAMVTILLTVLIGASVYVGIGKKFKNEVLREFVWKRSRKIFTKTSSYGPAGVLRTLPDRVMSNYRRTHATVFTQIPEEPYISIMNDQ